MPLTNIQKDILSLIVPGTLDKRKAKDLDPIKMKQEWIDITVDAESAIERVSNEQPDLPIGCAFVDQDSVPKWIEEEPNLQIHMGSNGGCWPQIKK